MEQAVRTIGQRRCISEHTLTNVWLCWVIGLVLLTSLATSVVSTTSLTAAGAQGIRIHFTTTKVTPGQGDSTTTETGTYTVAVDGRYRLDVHRSNGQHFVELVDAKQHRVVKLDFNGKQAMVGTDTVPWSGPGGATFVGGGVAFAHDSTKVLLGTRNVEGLVLTGMRQTFVYSGQGRSFMHVIELWTYGFEDATIPPIILEKRFESPEEINEKRVEHVESVTLTDETFAIPEDFAVVTLLR